MYISENNQPSRYSSKTIDNKIYRQEINRTVIYKKDQHEFSSKIHAASTRRIENQGINVSPSDNVSTAHRLRNHFSDRG